MQYMIRKEYAYYWQGKDRFGGDVVNIPEDEYKKVPQIFETAEYTKKVLAPKEVARPVAEEPKAEVAPEVIVEEPQETKPSRKRKSQK